MGERRIEDIDDPAMGAKGDGRSGQDDPHSGEQKSASAPRESSEPLVEVHYPDPTPLGHVLRDVAKWSGLSFVLEPHTHVKLQIFSPRKQSLSNAYELFLVSLSVVGLRAIQVGSVVKIVPIQYIVSA